MKSYVISVVHARFSAAGRCRRHCDEPRHEYDENQSHSHKKMARQRLRNSSTSW